MEVTESSMEVKHLRWTEVKPLNGGETFFEPLWLRLWSVLDTAVVHLPTELSSIKRRRLFRLKPCSILIISLNRSKMKPFISLLLHKKRSQGDLLDFETKIYNIAIEPLKPKLETETKASTSSSLHPTKKNQASRSIKNQLMADDDMSQERRLAAVVAAHAAVANVVTATYLALDIPKEPRIDRNEERQKYMDSILKNDHKCRSNLRMGVVAFEKLCTLIREQGIMNDTQNCKLEEMMMRFLHLLGHNVRHRVLEGRFYRSRETISRQFNETLNCVVKLYKCLVADHLKAVHEGGTPLQISSDPRFAEYFKDCVGALDGTHIDASVPVEEQDKFRGRKMKTTQNVLAACSFDLKFTYVLAGWEGTAHDQRVLDDALVRSNPLVVPQGRYYLVDAGYTHQPGFFAPYRGTRYHISEHQGRTPENEKELFNKRHALLRNAIERAFGVVKKRWPLLSVESFYPYKTQVKIVLACFILHNHIMGCDPDSSLLEEVDKELYATPTGENDDDATNIYTMSYPSQKSSWALLRNEIAHKMYGDYKKHRHVKATI